MARGGGDLRNTLFGTQFLIRGSSTVRGREVHRWRESRVHGGRDNMIYAVCECLSLILCPLVSLSTVLKNHLLVADASQLGCYKLLYFWKCCRLWLIIETYIAVLRFWTTVRSFWRASVRHDCRCSPVFGQVSLFSRASLLIFVSLIRCDLLVSTSAYYFERWEALTKEEEQTSTAQKLQQ